MSASKRFPVFVLVVGLFLGATFFLRNSIADALGAHRLKGTNICIPEEHVVKLSAGSPSETELYDISEGYDVSISISHSDVAQSISGYKGGVFVRGDLQYQNLYLDLYPAPTESLKLKNPKHLVSLGKAPRLFVQNYDPTPYKPMMVFEKTHGDYTKWGACTRISWENEPVMLECDRYYLLVGSIRVWYEVNEANLHLHEEIDQFITNKFDQWRCE